jgi:predicted Fe-Mo cluster-binding NifX family protein
MKIAFPTQVDHGLDSSVFGHFGSAPYFVLVDSASGKFETMVNLDQIHTHGNCQPLAALGSRVVEAVVVGGIGGGALRKLIAAGVKVYRGVEGNVKENLELMKSGALPEFTMNMTCAGHGAEGGCAE